MLGRNKLRISKQPVTTSRGPRLWCEELENRCMPVVRFLWCPPANAPNTNFDTPGNWARKDTAVGEWAQTQQMPLAFPPRLLLSSKGVPPSTELPEIPTSP